MELVPTTISAGYAAGLNAYGTVFLFGLLGRTGFGKWIKLALERRRARRQARSPSTS